MENLSVTKSHLLQKLATKLATSCKIQMPTALIVEAVWIWMVIQNELREVQMVQNYIQHQRNRELVCLWQMPYGWLRWFTV